MASDATVRFTFSSDTLGLPATTVTAPRVPSRGDRPAQADAGHPPAADRGGNGLGRRMPGATSWSGRSRSSGLVRSRARSTSAPLAGHTPVAKGDGFTTLVVSDAGRGRAIPVLQALWTASRRAATAPWPRVLPGASLRTPSASTTGAPLPRFGLHDDGGYAVVPWGGGDGQVTALALMAGDPRVTASRTGSRSMTPAPAKATSMRWPPRRRRRGRARRHPDLARGPV